MKEDPRLKQALSGWQIFFIVITVVIGSGCFIDYGIVARSVGPFGLPVTVVVVGFIAVCAMEGLSELTQLFPTVNPIVELVHEFVDEDLALCVGVSYWCAYASIMALQIARAASYLSFFVDTMNLGWLIAKISLFYVIVPVGITLLNCFNVRIFGMVESLGGMLKLIMLLVIVFMLYQITGAAGSAASFTTVITSTLEESGVYGSAICLAIENIAFSFMGIESMAVTAFEAKDSVDLRVPSKFMAYAVFWVYFILAIAISLCLDWDNANDLLDLLGQYTTFSGPSEAGEPSSTQSALIIAALRISEHNLASAMNGMFIFCAISAANSSLLASVGRRGVPIAAVMVSAVAFAWLPFTQIKHTQATSRLITWFSTSGSVCIFFMWGSLSLAYIRYWFAFHKYQRNELLNEPDRRRFIRRSGSKGYSTLLDWAQPVPAFVGLIGSFLIVWVFPSAIFWGRTVSARLFVQYYSMPLLLLLLLLGRKVLVWTRRRHAKEPIFKRSLKGWWHEFDSRDRLLDAIENLSVFSKPSQKHQYVLSNISDNNDAVLTSTEQKD